MAQKTIITFTDDLDGGEATQTVNFGLDGTDYEMDLNDGNAAKLRSEIGMFVQHARKVKTGGALPHRRRSAQARARSAEIREWAKQRGLEISERGRVPVEIIEAFEGRGPEPAQVPAASFTPAAGGQDNGEAPGTPQGRSGAKAGTGPRGRKPAGAGTRRGARG